MSDYKTQCPYCGRQLSSFESGDNGELTLTCPQCQKNIYVRIIGKQPYTITEDLYVIGESLPFKKKKDRRVAFRNWFISMGNRLSQTPSAVKYAIIAVLALAIATPIAYPIITAPPKIEGTRAYSDMASLWEEFRDKNPYNYQTVGIKQYDDNSFNIIISEPNNSITEESIQEFFKKYNGYLHTYKHKMGYDGWLRDAVISFNGIKPEKLPKLTSQLFELLYGTSYKAALMDLDSIPEHLDYSSESLNYQISEEEIRTWFIDNNESLISIDGGTIEKNILDILNETPKNTSELYYSKNAGFVVWVIDRSPRFNKEDFNIKARMFSIDSDLIFGAIANNNRVAIIARERSIPVYELPPMRQEMLMVLASTPKDELSQSYERNNLFAGKLKGGKDYAPILLSDELWHTEYGNILNITDQMLKSWSENGRVEYHGFEYPKPFDWAFDDGAIRDLGVKELTYNWNTAGAGYVMDGDDGLKIYAVNRTGSLPVSYIPGDTDEIEEDNPVFLAEESAYDFYSNLSSPELVKVVQYASMYQIFNNFGVHVISSTRSYPNSVSTNNLDYKAEAVLKHLCSLRKSSSNGSDPFQSMLGSMNLSDFGITVTPNGTLTKKNSKYNSYQEGKIRAYFDEISTLDEDTKNQYREELSKQFDKEYGEYKSIWALVSDKSYNASKRDYIESYISAIEESLRGDADVLLSTLDTIIDLLYEDKDAYVDGDPFLRVVGHYLINPRDVNYENIDYDNLSDDQYCQLIALHINSYAEDLKTYNKIMGIAPLEDTKAIYLEENKEKSLLWQKCPTIVESWWPEDSVYMRGGHNLNSRITPIKVNKSIKPGQYKVTVDAKTGRKIIEISSADKGRVTPSFLRNVERTNIKGVQSFKVPKGTVRPRTQVLAKTETRSARGFNTSDHLTIGKHSKGFTINGKEVKTMDGLAEEINKCAESGKELPFKTLELKEFSESEQIALFDNIREVRMKKSKDLSSVPKKAFNVSKIETTDMGNGITIVKVPIDSQVVELENSLKITAGGGGKSSVWKRIQSAWYEFKVPTNRLQEFKDALKDFFKDPKGTWSKFQFEHQLKKSGFDKIDINQFYEFKTGTITTAQLIIIYQNQEHNA